MMRFICYNWLQLKLIIIQIKSEEVKNTTKKQQHHIITITELAMAFRLPQKQNPITHIHFDGVCAYVRANISIS